MKRKLADIGVHSEDGWMWVYNGKPYKGPYHIRQLARRHRPYQTGPRLVRCRVITLWKPRRA